MISINGKKFAENDEEMRSSILQSGGTCVGFVKRTKRSVMILDHQKRRVGVINQEGVIGAATLTKDGQWWYSYADVKIIGRFEKYSEQASVADHLSIGKDSKGYLFK